MLLKYIGSSASSIQNIKWDVVPLLVGSIFDIADDRAIEILNQYPDLYIPLETSDFMPTCSSPTTVTIENFSYSTVDILTATKNYVTGTAAVNGVVLTINCVLDTVSWDIMSNVEALAKFNRGSYCLQTSSQQYAIQSGNVSGWVWTAVVCWFFDATGNSNLSISTGWASSVNNGDNAIVSFTVTNNWPDQADDTEVTITLPTGTILVSADWTYNQIWQVVTWSLWDLISGQSVTINVTCTYTQTGGSAAMTFVVSSTTVDPTPWNNSSTRNLTVYYADLSVSLSGSNSWTILYTALNGDEASNAVTQTIGVSNTWPTQANAVTLIVTLPANVNYVSLGGGTWNAWLRTITWVHGTLANGASTSRNFTVKSAIVWTYTLDWEVTATSPDGDPLDNTTSKNLSFANWVADMSITKIDESSVTGDITIDFRLPWLPSIPQGIFGTIGSQYNELLGDVVVTLPVDVDYVSSSYTKQWLGGASSTVSWVYSALDRTITFVDCLIPVAGYMYNLISITVNCVTPDTYSIPAVLTPWQSFITDTNLANNTANLSLVVASAELEIRTNNIYLAGWPIPANVTALSGSVSGSLMGSFTEDIAQISGSLWRLGYVSGSVPAQDATSLWWDYGGGYWWTYYKSAWAFSYNGTDPTRTIDTEWEPF